MLRITCEGLNAGAEVTINGQFKGECPIDLQVAAGMIKLQGIRRPVKDHPDMDRILEQDIRIGDGVIKKIELKLVRRDYFLYLEKANAGDVKAMRLMGSFYSDFSTPVGLTEDKEKAFEWYLKAAEAGDSESMFEIANGYGGGDRGVQANVEKSKQWYRRALELSRKEADEGSTEAMVNLGKAYVLGRGVPVDREKAAMWFRRAGDSGSMYLKVHELQ
jgi:TPR repeat protein